MLIGNIVNFTMANAVYSKPLLLAIPTTKLFFIIMIQ